MKKSPPSNAEEVELSDALVNDSLYQYTDVYNTYRNRAKKRNREFSLDPEDIELLCSSVCHYCGTPPSNGPHRLVPYQGIDRVDNSLGYTLENSVPCCPKCNYMKGKGTKQEFINHAWKIVRWICNM